MFGLVLMLFVHAIAYCRYAAEGKEMHVRHLSVQSEKVASKAASLVKVHIMYFVMFQCVIHSSCSISPIREWRKSDRKWSWSMCPVYH